MHTAVSCEMNRDPRLKLSVADEKKAISNNVIPVPLTTENPIDQKD